MSAVLLTLILVFGCASYFAGIYLILTNKYQPNIFSRIVWLLLAGNTTAGVIVSKSGKAAILLALIFLIGNALICLGSFWKGEFKLGKLEYDNQ